jgi:hypothetical protein
MHKKLSILLHNFKLTKYLNLFKNCSHRPLMYTFQRKKVFDSNKSKILYLADPLSGAASRPHDSAIEKGLSSTIFTLLSIQE